MLYAMRAFLKSNLFHISKSCMGKQCREQENQVDKRRENEMKEIYSNRILLIECVCVGGGVPFENDGFLSDTVLFSICMFNTY